MSKTEGIIFNIQRFSVHDGPGARTTIFFKGCNLHCIWCHNPESISSCKEIEFYQEKCIGCDSCYYICSKSHFIDQNGQHQIDRTNCDACFKCVHNCFAEAIIGVGTVLDVQDLMNSILTDKLYFENAGGGVTFSGGEPMLQQEFLKELLKQCKDNEIHTAVDTAGHVPWYFFESIIEYTDLFLFDIKAASSDVHQKLTGIDNKLILRNLDQLSKTGKDILIRVPFITGVNDQEISNIACIMNKNRLKKVDLVPYHKLGNTKYLALNQPNNLLDQEIPSDNAIENAIELMQSMGLDARKS